MKILAVGIGSPAGGLTTITKVFIDGFRELGLDCTWLLFGSPPDDASKDHTDIIYVPLQDDWNYYADPRAVEPGVKRRVSEIVREVQPDVLFRPLQYSFEPYVDHLSLPTFLILELLSIPLILSAKRQSYALDPRVVGSLSADMVRLRVEHGAYLRPMVFISNSETTARDWANFYPEHAGKPHYCSKLGATGNYWQISDPKLERKALYFGRFNHQKGIPHLLKPVPEKWQLDVVGRGKWDREQFEPFGIRFHDWVEGTDLSSHLEETTFCIFPSHYEPWGIALSEALAAGRICVAQMGAGGHEEQIRNGENGFLIDFGAGSFWDALEEIASKPHEELSKMSRLAREHARPYRRHVEEVAAIIASHP